MNPVWNLKYRYKNTVTTTAMKRIAKFVQKNAKYEYAIEVEQIGNHWDITVLSPDLSIDHNGNVRVKYVQS